MYKTVNYIYVVFCKRKITTSQIKYQAVSEHALKAWFLSNSLKSFREPSRTLTVEYCQWG